MAKIYPEIEEDYHGSYGEFQIFESLKQLPNDWYIYHSLNWKDRSKNGRITWGEADFVIFNKSYGILVIEVKSGGISFKDGKWLQTRLDNFEVNEMKNPFNQANRSKYKLIDEIDYKLPYGDRCFIDKAVWFPSISNAELDNANLPLEYDRKLILTKKSLNNPLQSILSIYNFYNSTRYTMLSRNSENLILETIMPSFNLVPSASNIKDEADYVFYQLTNEQKKVLDFISDQQTVAIQGSAGTGKTFIAVEQAKRLSADKKVLFLCFNRFLYYHLDNKCKLDNVDYYNLHTFLSKYSSDDISTDDRCLKALKNIDFENDLDYQAIIIDEAQDISDKILIEFYEICKRLNYNLYLFYDKNQMLFQNKLPKCLEEFDCKLTLTKNCRNTLKIVQTINSVFNINTSANGFSISGIMPTFYFIENDIQNKLNNIINDYISSGFNHKDITILTLTTEEDSCLKGINRIGKFEINHESNDSGIFFTTSKKFKGLESNIIIVIDFDASQYNDYEYMKNLYVSLSRARQRLSLICNNKSDLNLLANEIEGNLDNSIKVARKFKVKIEE
mgnify:CR=1 FL=1